MGVLLADASPGEATLIEETLDQVPPGIGADGSLRRLVYDKAADSDALRGRLAERGVELICPHRRNRVRRPLQDGRSLRRYRRRWIIERTIAWLGNWRRLIVRHERYPEMYLAFVHLACAMMVLSRL